MQGVGDRELEDAFAPLLDRERRREVAFLAARSPNLAANIAELSVVKRGSYALDQPRASERLRVVVWNVERGRAPDRWAAIEAVRTADVLLLCEVDDGMA